MRTFIVAALALAIAACTNRPPPVTVESLTIAATSYVCPERDPAQPNCKVKP